MLARDLDALEEAAQDWDGPAQGAGVRAVDDGGGDRADPPPGSGAGRSRGGRGPDRLAGRGRCRARRRDPPSGCPARPWCSSSTSRRCRPCWPAPCPTASGLQPHHRSGAAATAAAGLGTDHGRRPGCSASCTAARAGGPAHGHRGRGRGRGRLDLSLLRRDEEDGLAEMAEAGLGVAGRRDADRRAWPPAGPAPAPRGRRPAGLRICGTGSGMRAGDGRRSVVVTPSCGLAGAHARPAPGSAGPVPGSREDAARADRGGQR